MYIVNPAMISSKNLRNIEIVNLSKLRYIVSNYETYRVMIENSSSRIQDRASILTNLQSYLEQTFPVPGSLHLGYRVVKFYKNSYPNDQGNIKRVGRYFPEFLMSLLSIPRAVRHTIGQGYTDLDMSNCHPTVMMYLCEDLGIPYDNIKHYIENRNEYILAFESLGIKKGRVKMVMLALLNLGGYRFENLRRDVLKACSEMKAEERNPYIKALDMIARFERNVSLAIKSICSNDKYKESYEHYHIFYLDKLRRSDSKKKANPEASFCNTILFSKYEDEVIQRSWKYVERALTKNGRDKNLMKFVPCFDGVMINKSSAALINLDELSSFLTKKMGFDIMMTKKDMNEGIDLSFLDASEEEFDRAMNMTFDIDAICERVKVKTVKKELNHMFTLSSDTVSPFADYQEENQKWCAAEWMNTRYCCVAINSCLGSGKTFSLIQHLTTSPKYDYIYVLTPRISYAHGVLSRLNDPEGEHGYEFKMYQNMKGSISHKYVVVQLESLNRCRSVLDYINAFNFKTLVVLDEAVSILSQLKCVDTHNGKYKDNIETFEKLLNTKNARVIVSDAFLNLPSIEFLSHYFPKTNGLVASMLVINNKRKQVHSNCIKYTNSLEGEICWRDDLADKLLEGSRVHVHCTNKKRIREKGIAVPKAKLPFVSKDMFLGLKDYMIKNATGNIAEYTSSTSNKDLKNIVSDLHDDTKIQAWVSSATVSVGIDLDKRNHFDSRFCHISSVSQNRVRDIFQALARVRYPIDRTLYLFIDDTIRGKACSLPISLSEIVSRRKGRAETLEAYRDIFKLIPLDRIGKHFLKLFDSLELENNLSIKATKESVDFFLERCNYEIVSEGMEMLLDGVEEEEEEKEVIEVVSFDDLRLITDEEELKIKKYKEEHRVYENDSDHLLLLKYRLTKIINMDQFNDITPEARDEFFVKYMDVHCRTKISNLRALREYFIEGVKPIGMIIDKSLGFDSESDWVQVLNNDNFLESAKDLPLKLGVLHAVLKGLGYGRDFLGGEKRVLKGDSLRGFIPLKYKREFEILFGLRIQKKKERKEKKLLLSDTVKLLNRILESTLGMRLERGPIKYVRYVDAKGEKGQKRDYTYTLEDSTQGVSGMLLRWKKCEEYRPFKNSLEEDSVHVIEWAKRGV
jgi:hypothetical protein